jgi:hypothetical protein
MHPSFKLPRRNACSRVLAAIVVASFLLANTSPAQATPKGVVLFTRPPSSYPELLDYVTLTKTNVAFSQVVRADGRREEIPNSGIIRVFEYPPAQPNPGTAQQAATTLRAIEAALAKYPRAQYRDVHGKLGPLAESWRRMQQLAAMVAPTASAAAKRGVTITTIDGTTYEDVQITKVNPDSISFTHSSGAATIDFENLPAPVQRQYNYDPKVASSVRAAKKTSLGASPADNLTSNEQVGHTNAAAPSFAISVRDLDNGSVAVNPSNPDIPPYWDSLEWGQAGRVFDYTVTPEAGPVDKAQCSVTLAYQSRTDLILLVSFKPLPSRSPIFIDNADFYRELGVASCIPIRSDDDWSSLLDAAAAYAKLRRFSEEENLSFGAVKRIGAIGNTAIEFVSPNCLRIGQIGLLPSEADEFSNFLTNTLATVQKKVKLFNLLDRAKADLEKRKKDEREEAQRKLDALPKSPSAR